MNGTSTRDLTHVQVVRLVITSGPCVTFFLKSGGKQRKQSLRQQPTEVRPTPLRTQHRGSHDVTPPGSPTFRQFHLPGYPHKQRGAAVDSPSQLHMDVMRLECMPPPPYTPEVPSRHRLLAKGGEGQEPQGSPYQQPPNAPHQQQPQGSPYQDKAQGTPIQQEPQDTPCQAEPQDTSYQQEPLGSSYQQEPQETHCKEVAMEIIDDTDRQPSNTTFLLNPPISDGNDIGFDKKLENVFQDCGIMEQDCAPHPGINVMPPEEKTSLLEKEALINDTTSETLQGLDLAVSNGSLSPSTSPSPVTGSGRESFLSQIRQFNKAKLKKLATYPESNSSNQLQIMSSESNHTPDELQWAEDGNNSPQESVDATNLLSVLNQVLQNRARVLHDTLSSADEFDSSDDDDDNEWEL